MAKKASTNAFGYDPANFFGSFDPSKFMGDYDPAKMFGEFNKVLTEMKIPGMDVPAVDMAPLMDSQRKTFEAVGAANRMFFEGMQAVATRQTAMIKDAAESASVAIGEISKAQTPQDAVIKQTELAKDAYTKVMADIEELSGMCVKAGAEASGVVSSRFVQSLDEMRDEVLKLKN
ncbi:MAG: phasin family protein [Rhodospirillales bacterium]|nr:phasin family protein [Rhodospirillales bacterium]MCW8861757.1 phasin family protein [Rhodospirillales bacterium]MCW8951402.1 phasin family protein [Rhodospirillales bacterium]MCW8969937.1 phasin family protein [Rhodospirillales bacterium]MCW9003209.1 phasin family protein [Rhodospirillales bacterium]